MGRQRQSKEAKSVTALEERIKELERALEEKEEELLRLKDELRKRDQQLKDLHYDVKTLGAQCITLMKESERQIKQLQLLLSLAAKINSSLELRSVLVSILRAAEEITNAEASSILLKSGEGLSFEVATGEKADKLVKLTLKRGEGIAGYVAETGKPVIINDTSKDSRHKKEIDEVIGFKTRNLLAVPLRLNDEVIGVLEVINKRDDEGFDEADKSDLMLLAELSAIAIDKARRHEALQELFLNSIRALTAALDARDPYTRGHSERVTQFALAIAEELSLSEEEKKNLELAALLHDIGKVGIEDAILKKPGRLSPEEYELMKTHPEKGYSILKFIKQLEPLLCGVRYHHEHYDGSGYPAGLNGEEIPLYARIIAIADIFDALTSDRPYRPRFTEHEAIRIMREEAGRQLDPEVFEAFMRAYEKGKIRAQSYQDEV